MSLYKAEDEVVEPMSEHQAWCSGDQVKVSKNWWGMICYKDVMGQSIDYISPVAS